MTNLATLLDTAAASWPEREALVDASRRLTYREVSVLAGALAERLSSVGVTPGDRVALTCPNVSEFTVAYFAILQAGGIVVPLNVMLRPDEQQYHLEDSQASVHLVYRERGLLIDAHRVALPGVEIMELHIDDLGPIAEGKAFETRPRGDEDTAVILYTSGTTGRPKGAELRHRNLRDNARACATVYDMSENSLDRVLCALPLFHSFGQTCLQNNAFGVGATLVIQHRFEPTQTIELLGRERITVFAGVPTMYWALIGVPDPAVTSPAGASSLRVAASGGAALPGEIHAQFEKRFGIAIQEGYGLSETSPTATFQRSDEATRVGSIGRPIAGVDLRLIRDDWIDIEDDFDDDGMSQIGEIVIRGHNVMKGYWRNPEATAEVLRDGWFRTGDLARRDQDDYYYVVDRVKDLIIRGGFNVYPRELEEVLITHPAVSLVAVIGVPHPSHGEEIKAIVVPATDQSVDEADLISWCRERMAPYKYPRLIEFRDSVPTTSTGKILKRELR